MGYNLTIDKVQSRFDAMLALIHHILTTGSTVYSSTVSTLAPMAQESHHCDEPPFGPPRQKTPSEQFRFSKIK